MLNVKLGKAQRHLAMLTETRSLRHYREANVVSNVAAVACNCSNNSVNCRKQLKKFVKNFYNRNIFSIFAVELRFLRVSQEA